LEQDEIIQVYPSDNNHIIVEFISSGTAPDGSKFELPICTIFTIENEKIVKDFTYYDNFEE
jgi:ketosteroid isomerase-like protein